MKKYILVLLLGLSSLMAADGKTLSNKCVACHGASFEKQALGKSAIVKGQKAEVIEKKLIGYKAGTLNQFGMGAIMKAQTSTLSKEDMKTVSKYIASIK
jgi:cytochrome c553